MINEPQIELSREKTLNPLQVAAWQLRAAGHSIATCAQLLGIGTATVTRYCNEVNAEFAEMPEVTAVKARLRTLVPQALDVFVRAMKPENDTENGPTAVAAKAAKDVLVSVEAMSDAAKVEVAITSPEFLAQIQKAAELMGKAKDAG